MDSKKNSDLTVGMSKYDPGFGVVQAGYIWRIFQKLRRLKAYKDLNIKKMFEPLDPNHTGRVPAESFVGVLMGNIGYLAGLSRLEILEITHYFIDLGAQKVDYYAFIEFIRNIEPEPKRALPVELFEDGPPAKYVAAKDKVELEALKNIIDHLACVIISQRIHLDPYIREYENSTHMTGLISIPQLDRVFSKLGIMLYEKDFRLICKWYGKFGYLIDSMQLLEDFRKAVKRVYRRKHPRVSEVTKNIGKKPINVVFSKKPLPCEIARDVNKALKQCSSRHASQDVWDFMREDTVSLMQRLQKTAYTLKLRIRPHFHQFDPLNSGKCTVPQFRRGLDTCGFNRTGNVKVFISPQEMQDLIDLYSDPHMVSPQMVLWRAFVEDIESGSCIRELNRQPTADVKKFGPYGPSPDVLNLPCKYAGRNHSTLEELQRIEMIMEYIKHNASDCNFHQFFRSFDRFNNGHIPESNFQDVLQMCKIPLGTNDIYELECFFRDFLGFCYHFFLQLLGQEEPPQDHNRPSGSVKQLAIDSDPGIGSYPTEGQTMEEVMRRIKEIVLHRGLRLKDWFEEHDRLRTGIVTKDKFIQALGSAHNWCFSYREYKLLLNKFSMPLEPDDIQYKIFLDAVNEVCTQKNLQYTPLVIPVPFLGCKEIFKFNQQEIDDLGNAMQKLVRLKVDRADFRTFQNYDTSTPKRNALTYDQYLQALDGVGALTLLSRYERKLIFYAFSRIVNRWKLFDYREFLTACNFLYKPRFEELSG